MIPTLYKRHNKIRRGHGRAAQTISLNLQRLAQEHSEFMARQSMLMHSSNRYLEIIGYGPMTPKGMLNIWMNSRPHRAIIMSNKRYMGYGRAVASDGTIYWTGMFANEHL